MAFRICVAMGRVHVEVDDGGATYTLQRGSALEISHFGETLKLSVGVPIRRTVPPVPRRERPSQPSGREPRRRRAPSE
jgi:alpha,alpha-trehalose phosphorylase